MARKYFAFTCWANNITNTVEVQILNVSIIFKPVLLIIALLRLIKILFNFKLENYCYG